MIADYPDAPPRLAPFFAQSDYMSDQVLARLEGLTDEELRRGTASRRGATGWTR